VSRGPIRSAADLQARLERARGDPSFQVYELVRARVLQMLELDGPADLDRSATASYLREELASFEHLFDASPLVIEKLRQHCHHLTGVRDSDYRSQCQQDRSRLDARLAALLELGGRDLLVPESPRLGGFGFQLDDGLYNQDTLEFYEALIALQQAAVLGELRSGGGRKLVWEIGAGWGGFAYQLKLLCPEVTYLITDVPERFLFSAVYLLTQFPQARVGFYGQEPAERLFERWRELDFVFLPHTLPRAVPLERLDLTLSLGSFQRMTAEQVQAYARRAFELDSTYLYSLGRGQESDSSRRLKVRAAIEAWYWPHEIELLPLGSGQTSGGPEPRSDQPGQDWAGSDCSHLVGWKRLRT
jgi:hypothetical protein